jgi:hypothetical protein
MRVEFELGRADFAAFTAEVWKRRVGAGLSARRWAVLALLVVVALGLGAALTVVSGSFEWFEDPVLRVLVWAIAIVVSLLVLIAVGLRMLRAAVVGRPPADPSMLGWKAIELGDEGVLETTESATELVPWSSVKEVHETDTQIHLYLGPAVAHVIPKRAFANAADVTRFVERARAKSRPALDVPVSASGWSRPVP